MFAAIFLSNSFLAKAKLKEEDYIIALIEKVAVWFKKNTKKQRYTFLKHLRHKLKLKDIAFDCRNSYDL